MEIMAVIVYGMDMPTSCVECKFQNARVCKCADRPVLLNDERPEWCPLKYKYMKQYETDLERCTRKKVVMDRIKTRQERIYYERKNAGCCVLCGQKDFRTEYLHKINCEWCAKHISQLSKIREQRKKENVHK